MSEKLEKVDQTEELLARLRQRQVIIDGVSEAMMLLTADSFEILEVNRAFLDSYGLKRCKVIGQKCYALIHHLDRPCHLTGQDFPCPLVGARTIGRVSRAEHVHFNGLGQEIYSEIRAFPLTDEDGRPLRIVHLARDITNQKQLENELEKAAGQYRSIFNSIPNPLFVLETGDLRILDLNDRVFEVYGYKRDELIETCFLNLGEKEDRNRIDRELKQLRVVEQLPQITKKGRKIFVNLRVSPSEYAGRKVLLAAVSDVTDKLHSEQQIVQVSKMTTLGEMATGLAHELNQPLSVIKTSSSFLIRKIKKQNEVEPAILKTLLVKIDGNVDRAARLINRLREFGRKPEVVQVRVQVNDALTRALEIFSQQLKLRNIEVEVQMAKDLPLIMADSNRLEQVFINLLLNARDAIDQRWGSQDENSGQKKIRLTTRSQDGKVLVEIKDNGTGIPADILSRIYEPFFTTKEVGKGIGLGLSMSYGIVRDYHGTIEVFTRENQGATFVLSFPAVPKDEGSTGLF